MTSGAPVGNNGLQLVFDRQPGIASVGTPVATISVAIQDAQGNVMTALNDTVEITMGNNPTGATLTGTTRVAASNGVASFTDLQLDRAGNGYTFQANASGVAGTTSQPFDVVPAGGGGPVATFQGDLEQFLKTEVLAGIPIVSGSGINVTTADQKNQYVIPTPTQVATFRQVLQLIIAGQHGQAHSLVQTISSTYNVIQYTDTTTNRLHYLLVEGTPGNVPAPINGQASSVQITNAADPDLRGWGTYVFSAAPGRDLSLSAPHPKDDFMTGDQAVEAYLATDGHSLLLAGMDRDQNMAVAVCDPSPRANHPYREADMSHNEVSCFQVAFEEVYSSSAALHHVQFHGNSTGPDDVFISNGVETPIPLANTLAANIRAESAAGGGTALSVDVFDNQGDFLLRGIKNTQMRFASGIAHTGVCQQNNFPVNNSRFLHVEQRISARRPASDPQSTPAQNREVITRALVSTF